MARIRTIKPTFFRDHGMAELPLQTRLTFIGLWTYADDEGRGLDDARLVKGDLWSLDDAVTVRKVEADLTLLAARGYIARYELAGRRYLAIVNWKKHQKINRPTPSTLPVYSVSPPGDDTEGSNQEEGTGNEEKEEGSAGREPRSYDDVLRAGAPPDLLAELDNAVAVLIRSHGIGPVNDALASLLDSECRYPFPSNVRAELEAILGTPVPRDTTPKCAECGGRFSSGSSWLHSSDCSQARSA